MRDVCFSFVRFFVFGRPLVFGLILLALGGCEDRRFRIPDRARLPDPKTIVSYRAAPPLSFAPGSVRDSASRPASPLAPGILQPAFGHPETPRALAIDPGGMWIISGGEDRQVVRWRLPDGQRIRTWADFPAPIRALSIAPDGRRWAALSGATELSLWSTAGQRLQRLSLPSKATSIRFAPIQPLLFVALSERVLVLDAISLAHKDEFPLCPKGERLLSIDIESIRQAFLAAGCSKGTLIVRPLLPGLSIRSLITLIPGGALTAVAFAPLGLSLATASQDGSLQIWQIASSPDTATKPAGPASLQVRLLHKAYGHSRPIRVLRWKADGQTLASGSLDRSVGLWKLTGGAFSLHQSLPHKGAIEALEWMPDQPHLLTLDHKRHLQRFDEKGLVRWERKPLPIHAKALSFSPDGKLLLSEGEPGVAAIWDLATGQNLYALGTHPTSLLSGHFALDGNHVLTTDDHNLLFWDFALRRKIDITKPPKGDVVTAATLGRDWTQVFFGTAQNGVFLWTAAGQKLQYAHREPKHVTSIAVHGLRQIGAVGDVEGNLYLYDLQKHELLTRKKKAASPVTSVAFAPDGQRLAALLGETIVVFGLPDLRILEHWKAPQMLRAAAFSPDGKTLAFGGDDQIVYRWETPRPPEAFFVGCLSSIRALAFSPKAPVLAASCRDGGFRLWSLSSPVPLLAGWGLSDGHWLSFSPSPKPALLASSGTAAFFHLSNEDAIVAPSLLPLFDPAALHLRLSPFFSFKTPPTK